MVMSQAAGAVTVLCQVFHGSTAQALLWPFLSAVLAPVLLLLLLALATGAGTRRSSPLHRRRRLPPSPPSLPVLGHLHLVGANPHVSLRDLAGQYASAADGLMLLRLGQVPNLVVSSPRAAHAVLRAHDHVFASRPRSAASDVLLHGPSDVAMAPYGEYWRQARKLVTVHLLSASKVRSLRAAREDEVCLALAEVREAAAARAAVDVSEMLSSFANDVACRAVSGRLYPACGRNRNRVFRELLDGSSALLGSFHLDNYFPSLAKVDVLARVMCAGAKRLRKRWDEVLDEIIGEHVDAGKPEEDDGGDFVDVLLSLQQEYGLTTDQTKGIVQDMLAAGTDTSYIVLEYCMVELIRNPCILAKLQREVTKNTPKGQKMVEEDNISNMPYLKVVIKESLRLHPPSPLLLPHLSMAECEVNGYTIPAGTRVIVNAWAIARDAGSWDRADEFIPERFLDGGNGSNRTLDFHEDFMFLPFGAGRRVCPGANLGMATVEIMLANLVYCFDWEMTSEDVDMTDVFGSLMRRRDRLLLVPRIREVNLLS